MFHFKTTSYSYLLNTRTYCDRAWTCVLQNVSAVVSLWYVCENMKTLISVAVDTRKGHGVRFIFLKKGPVWDIFPTV